MDFNESVLCGSPSTRELLCHERSFLTDEAGAVLLKGPERLLAAV
jgi:hypothetical protein